MSDDANLKKNSKLCAMYVCTVHKRIFKERERSPSRIGVSSFAPTLQEQRVLAIYFSKGSHTFSLYSAQSCPKAPSIRFMPTDNVFPFGSTCGGGSLICH